MMDTPDLAAIRARVDAATEGPWRAVCGHYVALGPRNGTKGVPASDVYEEADAEFIAHARTDIPALLALVESQRAEIDRLTEERDWHHARVLLAKVSGGVALRGGKPGDYWAEWHRTHCAAAQAATSAEAALADLRARIEALADEWDTDVLHDDPAHRADALRALLDPIAKENSDG